MVTIIQAKFEHLNQIYAIILELAKYENILDKIKITESQLGELLFCDEPNYFVGVALVEEETCGLVMFNYTQNNICVNVTREFILRIYMFLLSIGAKALGVLYSSMLHVKQLLLAVQE